MVYIMNPINTYVSLLSYLIYVYMPTSNRFLNGLGKSQVKKLTLNVLILLLGRYIYIYWWYINVGDRKDKSHDYCSVHYYAHLITFRIV